MTRVLLAAALCALPLSACNLGGVNSPGTVAAQTALDEKAGTTAENAYQAVSRLGEALVMLGALDKAKFKALDNDGYRALLAVRAAYLAGNAAGYGAAVANLNSAIANISLLLKPE